MVIALSPSQFKVLSEYCNDIAKGLFLGVGVNQVFVTDVDPLVKLTSSIISLLLSLIFLYLALLFSQEVKNER